MTFFSFGVVAREHNYVRPTMKNDGKYCIEEGRHPLQELIVDSFISNNFNSGVDYGNIHIITGPNASGKSVFIKQTALIIFLAHLGSFVPAKCATISLTDRIFTRIRTMESVSVHLSTFFIDINQMTVALNFATEKSLIVIDEFGKGTLNADGTAILGACIHNFVQQENPPHVLVVTHLHDLFRVLPNSSKIRKWKTEILVNEEEFISLFQIKPGIELNSHASDVAQQTGSSDDVIQRTAEILNSIKKNSSLELYYKCLETEEDCISRNEAFRDFFINMDMDEDSQIKTLLDIFVDTNENVENMSDSDS